MQKIGKKCVILMHVFGKMKHVKPEIVLVLLFKKLVSLFQIINIHKFLFVFGQTINARVQKMQMNYLKNNVL